LVAERLVAPDVPEHDESIGSSVVFPDIVNAPSEPLPNP